jgi:hypothetical protein
VWFLSRLGADLMISNLLIDWLTKTIENAPLVAFLALAAWDLRSQLITCIKSNDELKIKLLNRFLDDDDPP